MLNTVANILTIAKQISEDVMATETRNLAPNRTLTMSDTTARAYDA
jgi:hypothetical protein